VSEWYIEDIRSGLIDGFYSNKDMAENQMLWCVKEYKRWFVLKLMQPHETIDDFVFWNETDADWYLDYLEL
tara:strand:- start:372 stop:584 length:213 start_codon:yes stop_codon:yes gene_type:complete